MFQEEYATLREKIPYVTLHRYNQKYLFPQSNGWRDTDTGRTRLSCGSTHCICLTWCIIHTLCVSVLEATDKPSHTAANALRKVLGNLSLIFKKLLRVFLAEFMYVTNMLTVLISLKLSRLYLCKYSCLNIDFFCDNDVI